LACGSEALAADAGSPVEQTARFEGLGTGRQRVDVPERDSLAALSANERAAWDRALAFYGESVAALNHFDAKLLELKGQLVERRGDLSATPPDVIPGIAGVLTSAMPVYHARWWPAHERANRTWIEATAPLLRRHEERFVELSARIYDAKWPRSRFRIDVSAYANPAAGYTEPGNGHIVIFSTDAGNQGLHGLETIFHEIQHAAVIGSSGREGLRQAFRDASAKEPENLWHGIIFTTAGAFVGTVAERERLRTHEPYWIKEGIPKLRGWSGLLPATSADWLPVVRGDASPRAAFAALAKRFR
jgi:hypothetical protein